MTRPHPLLALALAAGALGCGGSERAEPPVVVLAVDGLEWSVLRPLMESGRAPHLAALAERGLAGELVTMTPTFSPVVWTTVATGVTPDRHGILFFTEIDPEAGERLPDGLPYTSNCRRVPAIWNVAGEAGRSVLSVAWWVSWPAEPVPRARIVASYAAQAQAQVIWKPGVWEEGIEELTHPDSLQERIAPLLRAGAPDGPLAAEFHARFEGLPDGAAWALPRVMDRNLRFTFHGDRTHQRILCELLDDHVADLNLLYLGLADVAGHYYWRYREPEAYDYAVPAHHVEALGGRIDAAYEAVDAWIGEVLERVPADARVLVVSDHGMHADRLDEPRHLSSGGHVDGPAGVVIAAGPGVRRSGLPEGPPPEVGTILDVYPTLLAWLDLPVPADADGEARRDWMTAAWREAHPPATVPTYAEGFRPATPPRSPGEEANEAFVEGMKSLGYF